MAEAFGIATGAIGLAATVFQTAKGIRDIIHTAMSEKQDILDLLQENQEEMDLLADLYNKHKEHLEQAKLTHDLERLRAKITEYYKWLVKVDDGEPHRKVPTLKAVWKAGDLKPKLEEWNRNISRIHRHWQDQVSARTIALLQDTNAQVLDRLENQDRMLTSTALTLVETIHTEATEVIKVIQHTTVQTRSRSLSVHSQVEPDGFTSQTTRVAISTTSSLTFSILSPDASLSYDTIEMRLEEYSRQLESDSPTIEFFTENGKTISCKKQVAGLKEQLNQAKDLLQAMTEAKDVPTIEAIHRLRDLARVLDHLKLQEECLAVGDCAIKLAQAFGLQAVEFQKEEAQTITLIASLHVYKSQACPLFIKAIAICDALVMEDGSDLAKVALLDALGRAGTCSQSHRALRAQWLARAIGLISELPSATVSDNFRGRTYFAYACILGVLEDGSKALAAAEQAVAFQRSLNAEYDRNLYENGLAVALINYGCILHGTGSLGDAHKAIQEAVSLCRTQAVHGEKEDKQNLGMALFTHGKILLALGHLEDGCSAMQENISLLRTLAVGEDAEGKENLITALTIYGNVLHCLGHPEDACSVREEVVFLHRAMAVDGQEVHKRGLAETLLHHGKTLHDLDYFDDARSMTVGGVTLFHTLTVDRQGYWGLAYALHNHGVALHHMGRLEDALCVRQEALSLLRTRTVDGQEKHKMVFAMILGDLGKTLHDLGHLEDACSVKQEAVSLFRTLAVDEHDKHKSRLAGALHAHGITLQHMGNFEDAISVSQEAISLYRTLDVSGQEEHQRDLAAALSQHGTILHDLRYLEDALSARQEAVSLFRTLAVDGYEDHKRGLAYALYHYGTTLLDMRYLIDGLSVRLEAASLFRALAVGKDKKHKKILTAPAPTDRTPTLMEGGWYSFHFKHPFWVLFILVVASYILRSLHLV